MLTHRYYRSRGGDIRISEKTNENLLQFDDDQHINNVQLVAT